MSEERALALRPQSLGDLLQVSNIVAKSSIIPLALRNKPEDVAVVMMTGHDLGLSPAQSVRGIAVVEGKPCMQADLMVALCARSSDVCEYFTLIESTPEVATWETKRRGVPAPTRMSFTIQQAQAVRLRKRDGGFYLLTEKDNWRNYPDAMLRARCAAALARAVYPDLLFGLYTEDEAREAREATLEPTESFAERARAREAKKRKKTGDVQEEPPSTGREQAAAVDAEVVEDGEPASPVSETTEEAPADGDPADSSSSLPEPIWADWRGGKRLVNAIDFYVVGKNRSGEDAEFIDFAPIGKLAGTPISDLSTSDIHTTIASVAARLADGSLAAEDRRMVSAYYNSLQREMLQRPTREGA